MSWPNEPKIVTPVFPPDPSRDGFYWVMRWQASSEWEPAKWHANTRLWYFIGFAMGKVNVFCVGSEIVHESVAAVVVDKKGRKVEAKASA